MNLWRCSILVFAALLALAFAPAPFPHPERGGAADSVARELRLFRTEADPKKRVAMIPRFGKIRDPRVTVALMEVVQEGAEKDWALDTQSGVALLMVASSMLVQHHIPEEEWITAKYWTVALLWWEKHGADVRRRASALPR
jgi:hypothetical protein